MANRQNRYIVTSHGNPLASFQARGDAEAKAAPLALKPGAVVRIHDTRRNVELLPVFDQNYRTGRFVRRWVGPTVAA